MMIIDLIMLLEVSYKIIPIVIHQCLQPIVETLDHETQCGFREGRGCMDAVFAVKLNEKNVGSTSKKLGLCL